MKPDKHSLTAVGILIAAACLIALTWVGTTQAIHAQRTENTIRVTATLANQALTLAEQINRQILGLDQTLRILVRAWENNPRDFDLEAWRNQAVVLNGLSRDMLLTDENGIIRQSSVNEAINQNASSLDYFRALADGAADNGDRMYIGPATIDGIMRQWHMNVARALHYPDGSFAGAIDADYRIAAITDVFSQTDLGQGALVTLAGLEDGMLRGAVSSATIDPNVSVADTPMFAALQSADHGIWTGPSASDAVLRIHAFRQIPGRQLAVMVGMSEAEAMRPAAIWRQQAQLFAGCITTLLVGLALLLIHGTRLARQREALILDDRAMLAGANAQLEVARALATAKAEQLEATLAGMSDGVSMIDAHMCLVEWNARFPEIAGVPAGILRVGLPMEEILRSQVKTGQFGRVQDAEAEVERRMARLRVAPFGVAQRQRPDGHTLELRRNRLPDGGFVTLYSDVTEHKLAEEALRKAQAAAEAANAEKSRFVAIVSHEIRTPLNALLNTVRLLHDSDLSRAQQSLLAMARQSGDVLFGLINDILDMSQMEAGKLSIRPSLFELGPMLDGCVEMFAGQAAQRGLSLHVFIAEGTPNPLLTDPGRLRQVQLNLLSNAVKYSNPGEVWLLAEPGSGDHEAVRLTVKDNGPAIAPEARDRLFRPFARLERKGFDDAAGTGLGLSICHHLVTLMGGTIGCDTWRSDEGREGNAFWSTLPATALPSLGADGAITPMADAELRLTPIDLSQRQPHRARILLTEDIVANQVVTATLLRRLGHHVDIAANGPASVEAMKTTPYDLVFMDIFMPGMSGQEATQIIRGLPEPACSTPIVALTANVAPEDEALFRAAGMNGLLGKPVSSTEMLVVLDQFVSQAGHRRADFVPPPALNTVRPLALKTAGPLALNTVKPSAKTVLSAERINELRTNLAPATFVRLMEECLVDMDHRLPALRRALVAGSPGAVTAHAHAMVGMAAGYGMAALEDRLRQVMDAARIGDLSPLGPGIVAALEKDFERAAKGLRDMLRTELV